MDLDRKDWVRLVMRIEPFSSRCKERGVLCCASERCGRWKGRAEEKGGRTDTFVDHENLRGKQTLSHCKFSSASLTKSFKLVASSKATVALAIQGLSTH